MMLEVDHRRTGDLDPGVAVENCGGGAGERDVLVQGPDPPLAAIDGLADLEGAPVGGEGSR